ncbi:MAG TPA: hypothetical protein ENH94_05280 [Phycisphaerales bacterium]|nr:hypothetical protein [Phycisphaerales bacterium]
MCSMLRKKKILFVLVINMVFCVAAEADTLELLNGSIIMGDFMGGTKKTVRFQVGKNLQTYPKGDVLAITFVETPSPATVPKQKTPPAPATPAQVQPASIPQTVTIPAGTRITVRTNETLDSKRHGTGHMFTGTLGADLIGQGQVIARRGEDVFGRLTRAEKTGRLAGQAELRVIITDIMIDEKPYPVVTSSIKVVGKKTGKQTVKNVGVAAGIGALVRGSKGAKRGAALGIGVSVLTEGEQVNIPAGTLLEFRLASPLIYAP